MKQKWRTHLAAQRGTELHELAQRLIHHQQKLPRSERTLNRYVNDCVSWRMSPEVVLFVSYDAFGTADAISFRRNVLRISDLKTGVTPTSPNQLKVYAAYFCIEYGHLPSEIEIELRIYQNDQVELFIPSPEEIAEIMQQVRTFLKIIDDLRKEEEL